VKNFFIKTITTFFGVGHLPLIPGTFGSIAGVGVYFLIKANLLLYLAGIGLFLFLGFWFSGYTERIYGQKDPRFVVIDEVAGMLLSLLFVPFSIGAVIIGFVLFRILDTLKPSPAGSLQKLHGGIGIMIDDVIAGIYTNIILQVVFRLMIK
jgi:phosphatidylglycerophosphatase A